jgi:regulator of nonsense transcripts 2
LQDLFAELRPNMTRYSSIEEVNAALIELEEHEHAVSTDKANNEKHSDSENPPIRTTSNSISANGQSIVNGAEENGLVHDDIGDSDSDSGSGSTEPGGHDDEDLDEENHDGGCDSEDEDDDDGGGPASDDDDEVHVRQTVAEVDPQEEASFELELRAVMQV